MKNLLLASLIMFGATLMGQQTVRGKLTDSDTKAALVSAIVVIEQGELSYSGASDQEGNYRIDNVPVGRVNISVMYSGYEDKVFKDIIISIAKEKILDVEMIEDVAEIGTVEIAVQMKKEEVDNEMATSSARTFSVEETKRFAGSFNDPARMVSAFAGVTPNASGDNDIVVRGNSSRGILWRLEGIEIPNPNHFGSEGATGGPINALNSAMLANSEFYSGAFAPEYGNAFSGVFDMKLRKGNNEKRETSVGIGILGLDATTEGPLSKNSKGSYLVNYRYSSLALLDEMGIVDFGGVPKYQDASFKLHLPTKKAGTFTLFGMGGLSSIEQEEYDELDVDEEHVLATSEFTSKMGVSGLINTFLLSSNSYLKSSISLSGNGNEEDFQNLGDDNVLRTEYTDKMNRYELRGATTLNHKFNKNHKLQTGVIYTQYNYNYQADFYDYDKEEVVNVLSEKGTAGMFQGFASWKYRMTPELTLVTGAHYSHFLLNNQSSFEPRAGLKWKLTPKQTLNAGFGVHSKLESFTTYFAKDVNGNHLNRDLDFSRATHYVLGYGYSITPNLNLKTEVYFQDLDRVGVGSGVNSGYSMINVEGGGVSDVALTNAGRGQNYGLELTLERYYSKDFFFMLTGSLYDSKYQTTDKVWKNAKHNGNYAANLLIGKEFQLGAKEKNRVLGLSGKVLLLGGKRYTQLDVAASKDLGESVWSDDTYGEKANDVFKLDVAIYYRRDKKKTTHEFKIDVQNASNNQAVLNEYWNPITQKVENTTQLSLLPVISYTIDF